MPLTLVRGEFRIVGASPDGDSIRFYPADPGIWSRTGITVRANAQGGVQLRLDAIDALETHYTPRSSPHPWHQNPALGNGAATTLLTLLGFNDVARNQGGIVTDATPPTRPGAILTKFADKYGRAVAVVFADGHQPDGADGTGVFLGVDLLKDSVNWELLDAGWVYPTFYSQLFHDLRDTLADTARNARASGQGVWTDDATNDGFSLDSRDQLTEQLVILPKLFRRLAEYLVLDNSQGVDLAGFKAFLKAKADRLFTVPAGQATHLDTLIDVHGQQLRLTLPPEQIVFIEA
jgi:endonuclease YncB( thermonuclease family)